MFLLLPAVWRVSDMQAGRKENKFRLNIWLISHTYTNNQQQLDILPI